MELADHLSVYTINIRVEWGTFGKDGGQHLIAFDSFNNSSETPNFAPFYFPV